MQDISSAPLPQTLTYLIGDIARRHGQVKIASAGCCLISDDPALLVEICATRSLDKLGLRLLAPTVALSYADAPTTMATLRAGGYLPMPDTGGGAEIFRALGVEALGLSSDEPAETQAQQSVPASPDRVAELLTPGDLLPRGLVQQKVAAMAERILGESADPRSR